ATETAKKPEAKSRPSGAAAAPSTVRVPAEKPVVSSNPPSSASSLDALRQGKAAADGPMKTIYFNFDSFTLTADARTVLGANAAWLKANPSSMVEIEGHCDERGTTEYNLALGAKRARAAMDYLISLGVNSSRMKTISYGEELPVCREATEACHLNNRRARFVEIRPRPSS
ncbi:MAG: peptidoglycan-associated lipoprotein Pal, partial [Candidatus Binatia bacterium]